MSRLQPRPPGTYQNIIKLLDEFRGDPQEHLWVFALDASSPPCIASVDLVSKGHHNTQVVTIAEILRPVIVSGCVTFMIAHNHPIDNAKPTAADICMTKECHDLAAKMGLELLDHIIISRLDNFSFIEHGLL